MMTLKEKLQRSREATTKLKGIAEKNYYARVKLHEALVRLHNKFKELEEK